MFPSDAALAPIDRMVRYLAVFQRFFCAVIHYSETGDRAGVLLGGRLADALHNVPAMLRHCEANSVYSPDYMDAWMQEFPRAISRMAAPTRIIRDARAVLSPERAALDLQLRTDLTDVDLAPVRSMGVYLQWLCEACVYMRLMQNYGARSLLAWKDLDAAWSLAAEAQAEYNRSMASVLLPVPNALVHWQSFDEDRFFREALNDAEKLPDDRRSEWKTFLNEKAATCRGV